MAKTKALTEAPPRGKAYIYGMRAKSIPEFFYIGSTVRSLKQRLTGHWHQPTNAYMAKRLAELGPSRVEICLIEVVDVIQRFAREYEIMAERRTAGIDLLNIVLKGCDSGVPKSPSQRGNCTKLNQFLDLYESTRRQYSIPEIGYLDCIPDMFARKLLELKDAAERPDFAKAIGVKHGADLDAFILRLKAIPSPPTPRPYDRAEVEASLLLMEEARPIVHIIRYLHKYPEAMSHFRTAIARARARNAA